MRIQENPRTVSFTIFDADKLDPVTVFLQDFGGGCGRLIVECWCTAWAAYWGAMGTRSVREFVLDAHADYIAMRMFPQDRKHIKRDEAYLLRIVKVVQQALRDGAGVEPCGERERYAHLCETLPPPDYAAGDAAWDGWEDAKQAAAAAIRADRGGVAGSDEKTGGAQP